MDSKAKKILVISESIDINDSSGTKGRVALIHNLVKAGFDLKVLHYTPKEVFLEGIDCVKIKERKSTVLYFLSRMERVFTRITKINLNPYLESWFGFSFTFFNDVNSIKKAVKKEIEFKPDLVLTLSKGMSFRPHYTLLGIPEYHHKWMAYVHDPYPYQFYPRPYNWIQPGFRQKERFFLKVSEKAKYSAFPSQLLLEWMGSYFPFFLKTGVVIPHQNAKYDSNNSKQKDILPDYFDDSKFNLLHAGNLMKQRSPYGLIEGFKLFLSQNPEARKDSKLILLGNAYYHSKMLQEYQTNSPEIYIYNGNVDFETVYNLQKNVSVNVILESKSEISPFLPGKFPHCVEANKAILSLAPYYSEIRRLLGNDYPYWAEADEVTKIALIVESLYKLWTQHPENLFLNREDLAEYLSADYLKKIIIDLKDN